MNHGRWTAAAARVLRDKWESHGWEILFDHGDPNVDPPDHVGDIVSWFGNEIKKERRLAFLDIAIVGRGDRVFVLIEIEESTATPKVLLGDLFATLLGDHIKFKDRALHVGEWTSFILLAHGQAHSEQIAFVRKESDCLKSRLSSGNASIGHVIVDTYDHESDLQLKLTRQVENVLRPVNGSVPVFSFSLFAFTFCLLPFHHAHSLR